ncbi:amidohydrolase family protein [Arthrobacter sp. APC 3897]|uniref:amidohydrolase family protein n=1 Tax=Arthrobacter sp. APC 3897 TaxID=3035204 RepID=UPI0025B2EA79|nr:amidohydrolase family protein [Arthrobacter sp. APC 3897]MDN3480646.1 amidohydrolase family protein [Arthrobacter sp. APC 3897]
MSDLVRAIDTVCNFEFPGEGAGRTGWAHQFITEKIGADPRLIEDFTPENFIDYLDDAGVEHAFLIAVRAGSYLNTLSREVTYEQVAKVVQAHPTRFSGLAGIDPTRGMRGVRELEVAVKEHGFVGAHLYPHWFEESPDAARYYPYYAKCVELDIPIQMQVGHCLRYSAERPLASVTRPMALDRIACDFPELKLVGIHIGWPWTEEMIAVAYKHPNVYIGSDAYGPKHWSKEFVHYIDSWGQDKVLFGTDFPVINPERALREIAELPIRSTSMAKFLRNNAIDLYNLPLERAVVEAQQ